MPEASDLIHRSAGGLETWLHHNHDGTFTIENRQDVEAILEANKQDAVNNRPIKEQARKAGGWGAHAARIPLQLVHKWLVEEGLDVYSNDPDQKRRLKQKLNDPEWRHLRTSGGRL